MSKSVGLMYHLFAIDSSSIWEWLWHVAKKNKLLVHKLKPSGLSYLAFCSGSWKYFGMRAKYLLNLSHKSDFGTQPLWAWMAWYLASCLVISLKYKHTKKKRALREDTKPFGSNRVECGQAVKKKYSKDSLLRNSHVFTWIMAGCGCLQAPGPGLAETRNTAHY